MSTTTTPTSTGYAVKRLTVTDPTGRSVVSDLNLSLPSGTWANLTGPTIADLSRVLGAVSGRRPRESGTLLLDGRPLPTAPTAAHVGYVSRTHPLVATLTAAETLVAALMVAGHRRSDQLLRHAEAQLQALGLPPETWHNLVEQLSGGQQQRVALGRVLVNRPRLLVLDDPTSELDPDTAELVGHLLRRATRRGGCCLTQTRDPVLLEHVDRVIRLTPSDPRTVE